MWRRVIHSLAGLSLATVLLWPMQSASAVRWQEPTASELIVEVNNLRLANGLAPLNTHPILTQVAQSQADALLASEGAVGHGRPNGISLTQQLLILGYPLSGDLSLGGYRSENFVFGYGMTPQDAVSAWQGDDPHLNTMLSPNRSDIGAGVAIAADGTVYYVIDTALQTASGQPQEDYKLYLPGGGASPVNPEDALNQFIVPITVSTPRPNGDVYHKVQYGQTLWGLAIEYHTTKDEIRRLNNLGDSDIIYPNQLLLVMRGATPPAPAAPTSLSALADDSFPGTQLAPRRAPTLTPTGTPVPQPEAPPATGGPSLGAIVLVMALLIVVGGGTAAWFIREPAR